MGHDDTVHLVNDLPVRRLSQQRIDGLADQADAGIQDEQGNDASHIPVQIITGEMMHQHADHNDDTGDHIVPIIRTCRNDRQ